MSAIREPLAHVFAQSPAPPGGGVPNITPRFDFPGVEYLFILVSIVLGALVFALIGLFFVGLVQVVGSFRGKRDGGAGGGAALMVASVLGLAVVLSGTAFLGRLVGLF